jgi:hypothetical protein
MKEDAMQTDKKQNEEKETDDKRLIITKIKYKEVKSEGYRLDITYAEYNGMKDTKETVFKSYEPPHVDFIQALEGLKPVVLDMLELPDDYGKDLTVQGVTVGTGATITALKKIKTLDDKVLCLNTPFMQFSGCLMNDLQMPLPPFAEIAVEELIKEAEEFMDGKRQYTQLKLV